MTDFRALVDTIRDRVELAQLISRDIELKPAGSVLKGHSPFRHDSDPSFVVWPHTQTWRDFSGGSSDGGDCIDYVMAREGVAFWDALRLLASEVGVEVPGQSDHTQGDERLNAELERLSERRRVERLLTEAARYYHHTLPSKLRASWYHERYGFTDETIDTLLLGWADGRLYDHLTRVVGATEQEALATGLFVRFREGAARDFFQQRLVFPYWRRGRVVYFIARQTELTPEAPWEQAKYKKLLTRSERHAYVSEWVQNDTFYNEDAALNLTRASRSARGGGASITPKALLTPERTSLLVTEGVTDCISAMQVGVPCISPVTVRFRKKDLPKLLSLTERISEVVICNDSEDSGAGEAGANETAAALNAEGRAVRIARIPRPEGMGKIDLNELVTRAGPEALHRVIREAPDWCEYLIQQLPAELPRRELNARLHALAPLLRAADPVLQDGYAELLKSRFKLRAQTVRQLMRGSAQGELEQSSRHRGSGRDDLDDHGGIGLKGEVHEDTDHYYLLGRRGEPIPISTFQVEPLRRITTEEGDLIDADVTTTSGRVYRGVRFSREVWQSKRNLLRLLKSTDMLWTGSDDNVQGVLKLISERSVPILRGVTNLGYAEIDGQALWVVPESVVWLNQTAPAQREVTPLQAESSLPQDVTFVSSGDVLHQRLRPLMPVAPDIEAATAAVVLPKLLELNTPEVILPILGWFFAAPLKPRIHSALGHFPILCVWGTQGSGKSSIIMEVFWPLMGVRSAEPFSATETEFALIKLLSSTNSIPVFIDEYKPFDMPRHRRNTLHRYMRRLYTGEAESRGRADQSVVSYRLHAPLCLAGETRPIESALVERIITANPSKDTLPHNPHFIQAFQKLKTVDLGLLTRGLIRHLLSRDTEADLALARQVVERALAGREVPLRMRDNLIATVCGLIHFKGYAASLSVSIPEFDVSALITSQRDDLLESGGSAVKTGLDLFLEILSTLAVTGSIECNRQYTYSSGHLALHVASCHAAYAEHCRRISYEGEVLDKKALVRQLQENHRRGGYVVDVSRTTSFGHRGDKRRAAFIDLEAAKRLLDFDDLPQEPNNSAGSSSWSRGW